MTNGPETYGSGKPAAAMQLSRSAVASLAGNIEVNPDEIQYVIVFRGASGYVLATPESNGEVCEIKEQAMSLEEFIEHIKEEILHSCEEDGWSYFTFNGYLTSDGAEKRRRCCFTKWGVKFEC